MEPKDIHIPPEVMNAAEQLRVEVMQGRHITEGIPVKGLVTYKIRKWIPDPNGPLVGVDGTRGRYEEPKLVGHASIDNLLNNGGRDLIHTDMYTTTAKTGSGFNYIGLSVNTTAPAATDTDLSGEITTGGLARVQATTRTHTTGTNTSTIQHTFTATTTHTAVQKSALFNQAGPPIAGTMGHENTFTPVTLQNNDQLQVTWTITAG